MVRDGQVLLMRKWVLKKDDSIAMAAATAGMSEPTARKYLQLGQLPK